jgi:hypothetical protein
MQVQMLCALPLDCFGGLETSKLEFVSSLPKGALLGLYENEYKPAYVYEQNSRRHPNVTAAPRSSAAVQNDRHDDKKRWGYDIRLLATTQVK